MYEYRVLSEEEKDDIIVEFFLVQERDKFCHEINLERFNRMLQTLPEGNFKERIKTLRDETQARLNEVNSIIEATIPQLPPEPRLSNAISRIRAKQGK